MDEHQSLPAENPIVAEDSNVAVSPAEEPTTSVESVEPEAPVIPPVETPAPETEEPERKPERPAERRIRQLSNELKQKNEELDRLNQSFSQPPQAPNFTDLLQGRDSIDPEELNRVGQQFAAQVGRNTAALEVAKLRDEMSRKDAMNQFDRDTLEVSKELEGLPEEIARSLEEKITNAYKARAIKANPYNPNVTQIDSSVRLADVARDYLDIAKATADYSKLQALDPAKTATDTSALTPTNTSTTEEPAFADLSVAEMEKRLKAQGFLKP